MPAEETTSVDIRIAARRYWRTAGPMIALLLGCMGYGWYLGRDTGQPAMSVMVIIMLGSFVALIVATYARFRIRIDAEMLDVRTLWTRRRVHRHRISSVVWIPFVPAAGPDPDRLALAVVSHDPAVRPVRIGQAASNEDLAHIAAVLEVPEDRLDGVYSAFTIGSRLPQYATFEERHWKSLTALVGLLVLVLIGAGVTTAMWLDGTL